MTVLQYSCEFISYVKEREAIDEASTILGVALTNLVYNWNEKIYMNFSALRLPFAKVKIGNLSTYC